MTNFDLKATAATRARYARVAPYYDLLEIIPEWRYRPWRKRFWRELMNKLPAHGRLLEIGVGTGKNMPFWPETARITAIDLTPGMLERAQKRADSLGIDAQLALGDAQALQYADGSFDIAAATFVFCSIPDPLLGLRELQRVVRPGGWIFLMEHVRAQNPVFGKLMDLLNPVVVRTMGPNINRDTVGNVRQSGLELAEVNDLGMRGIFKMMVARVSLDLRDR